MNSLDNFIDYVFDKIFNLEDLKKVNDEKRANSVKVTKISDIKGVKSIEEAHNYDLNKAEKDRDYIKYNPKGIIKTSFDYDSKENDNQNLELKVTLMPTRNNRRSHRSSILGDKNTDQFESLIKSTLRRNLRNKDRENTFKNNNNSFYCSSVKSIQETKLKPLHKQPGYVINGSSNLGNNEEIEQIDDDSYFTRTKSKSYSHR